MNKLIKINCIEINQPIGEFYIGAMSYTDLINISYAEMRAIEDNGGIEYFGIQRELTPSRVKELKQYVNTYGASFPTAVILAIDSNNIVKYDKNKKELHIKCAENVAKIIDGQHRIAGLKGYTNQESFQINVTIFIDMEINDQAMVFSTINLAQTKVNKSLAYDLYEYAKARSPQKTCHNIVKVLNTKDGSPFYQKIKILGKALDKDKETITQATFVDKLMKYICTDKQQAIEDRDLYLRNKIPKKADEKLLSKVIFRNLFIEEKDAEIAKIVWNYFSSIQKKWPKAWNNIEKGIVLNRTAGFSALMNFLGDIYRYKKKFGEIITQDEFDEIFNKIDISEKDISSDIYKPGSSGQKDFYEDLKRRSGIG